MTSWPASASPYAAVRSATAAPGTARMTTSGWADSPPPTDATVPPVPARSSSSGCRDPKTTRCSAWASAVPSVVPMKPVPMIAMSISNSSALTHCAPNGPRVQFYEPGRVDVPPGRRRRRSGWPVDGIAGDEAAGLDPDRHLPALLGEPRLDGGPQGRALCGRGVLARGGRLEERHDVGGFGADHGGRVQVPGHRSERGAQDLLPARETEPPVGELEGGPAEHLARD